MISREQAEITRDHATNARASLTAHATRCRNCATMIPCELGAMLQRGAHKIQREARDALAAYLPAGSQVTYHGNHRAYQGKVWTVTGPSPRAPWAAYMLTGPGNVTFIASLESLQLSTREAQQRDRLAQVHNTVRSVSSVMTRHGVTVSVAVDRTDSGRVLVTWSSVEMIAAENRAASHADAQTRQYLSAALYLLQSVRAACSQGEWHQLPRLSDSARKLAHHAGARV